MKNKYPIYSDTHFNFTLPWTIYDFALRMAEENPAGLILPGDISCGLTIEHTLTCLAKHLKKDIYFVLGNHDFYSKSFKNITEKIIKLCNKFPNLKWMSQINSIKLGDGIGLVGEDGWYDGRLGNSKFLAYNLDWIMIDEFRKLKSIDEKFALGQQTADKSTANLKIKLEKALNEYDMVYILTHVPPWAEATRALGTEMEEFWLPYNVNTTMGEMIEAVMAKYPDKKVIVLSGHTHVPAIVHVSKNIECIVYGGKYLGNPTEHNCLFI